MSQALSIGEGVARVVHHLGLALLGMVVGASLWIGPAVGESTVVRQYAWEFAPKALRLENDLKNINEDAYAYYFFTLNAYSFRLAYEVLVASGPAVDVFLMDDQNFQRYQQGRAFEYLVAGTDQATTHSIQNVAIAGLTAGTYYLVVDNTNAGQARPPTNGVNDVAAVQTMFRVFLKFGFELRVPDYAYQAYKDIDVQQRRTHWGFLVTTDDPYVKQLGGFLGHVSQEANLQTFDALSNILAFSQSLSYTSDSVTTGFDEYPRFPIETLADDGGDCEDTAILYATLVRLQGFGVALLAPPQHMATGVAGTDLPGTYYEFNGVRYYFAETTGEGYEIGMLPSEYTGANVQVFVITGEQFRPSYDRPALTSPAVPITLLLGVLVTLGFLLSPGKTRRHGGS